MRQVEAPVKQGQEKSLQDEVHVGRLPPPQPQEIKMLDKTVVLPTSPKALGVLPKANPGVLPAAELPTVKPGALSATELPNAKPGVLSAELPKVKPSVLPGVLPNAAPSVLPKEKLGVLLDDLLPLARWRTGPMLRFASCNLLFASMVSS